MVAGLSKAISRMTDVLNRSRDNFDRDVANELADIIEVAGEKDYTAERLRLYKDGQRRFLEYGTDANYNKVFSGHELSPDAGQTMELKTAERAFYPVGNDLWVSMSQKLSKPPQAGDAVISGYGDLAVEDYNPDTRTWDGTDADGYIGVFDVDTGLDNVFECIVQAGTIVYSNTLSLNKTAGVFSIYERRLNWYDVGPSVLRQSFTDVVQHPERPQQNTVVGATSVDDGKAASRGSHRVGTGIIQAAGNTGLTVELGSIGVRTPGPGEPNFKTKGHRMKLQNSNTDAGVWQVCGAIRADADRPAIKLRFPTIQIESTPGSGVANTQVLLMAVDALNTDADTKTYETPAEHSPSNSVVEIVEDNTITMPLEDDPGTDISGAATANTTTNPGGYQLGTDSTTSEGQGSKSVVTQDGTVGNRELHNGDYCLVLVLSETAGEVDLDVATQQNS